MSRLRVHSFSISIDGYGAGPDQDLQNPLGVGGLKVFDWFFPTRTWQRMHGNEDGERGVDDDVAAQGFEGIGAYILGRNMFGPGMRPRLSYSRRNLTVALRGECSTFPVPFNYSTPVAEKGMHRCRRVARSVGAWLSRRRGRRHSQPAGAQACCWSWPLADGLPSSQTSRVRRADR